MGMFERPQYKALLLDIEGTVTSISFVKDVLFPYAYENAEQYLQTNIKSDKLKSLVDALMELSNQEAAVDDNIQKVESTEDWKAIASNVKVWIQNDRKLKPLKDLQGFMWEDAYLSGKVLGHVFPDVKYVLNDFYIVQIPVYIYSSGSVHAQKLLFSHSIDGDLTPLLSGYFDTSVGPKIDATSYKKIADQLKLQPNDILFLTDVAKEAIAASDAGMRVFLVVREGNAPLCPDIMTRFKTINCLEALVCHDD
uniref:Enolase-phosphatase E1 n=1 Tax=Panagrolaimus superbus TaxID=310955 RepID=A0A914YTR6_9BILA